VPGGGGSLKEFPENLIDPGTEPWNKWYATHTSSSWVLLEIPHVIQIAGIGFRSANDMPHRDPDRATVEIFIDGGQVETYIYDLDFDDERRDMRKFNFDAWIITSVVKITFENFDADEIQLHEIQLLS